MTDRKEKAKELFKKGYNCSQAVVLSFIDLLDIDENTALKLSSSFGGGMGRLREVCGAVSGMSIVLGLLYGYSDCTSQQEKHEHYQRIQQVANEFKDRNKYIVCRQLLGLEKGENDSPNPTVRTEEFYKKRPCVELVQDAVEIVENYIFKQKG